MCPSKLLMFQATQVCGVGLHHVFANGLTLSLFMTSFVSVVLAKVKACLWQT
jgi:hypothetical protein